MDAFEDVDVLELTQFIAGPNCGQWLATLGANVVKLEPPEGEQARDMAYQQFASYNLGGKQSVSVDLKTEEGREIARDLAERADVIVENYAPGVLERFGLDYESVSSHNEDVVYCSISAFGRGGPYSEYPGIDHLMQPISGLMAYVGYPECPNLFGGKEYLLGTNAMIDTCTGVQGALLVTAALMRRNRTEEGEFLDVALLDTAISFMGTWIAKFTAGEDLPRRTDREADVDDAFSPLGIFETRDGESIFIYGLREGAFESFCDIVGRDDLLADDRFGTQDDRVEHLDELREEVRETIHGYDRDGLFASLAEGGVMAGPFQDVGEIVEEDPHVEAREMLADTTDPRTGEDIRTAMIPFRTGSGSPDFDGPPRVGQDTHAVLAEMGYPGDRIEELRRAGIVTVDGGPDR